MKALKQALANVLEIASQQIDDLDDETMIALTQLLLQANERLKQMKESGETEEIEEAEAEQAEVANELAPHSGSPPTGGVVPPLESAPHESSNINAFRYDPKNGKLFVKFQGDFPSQNGPIYSYEGVPANIFDIFRRGAVAPKTSGSNAWHKWKAGVAPSHGASMYALIKQGGYKYTRLR